MSEKLANLSYYDSTGQEYQFSKPYSDDTAKIIDSEVKAMIAGEYERAKQILLEKKTGHNELSRILLEKEIIYSHDLEVIFGKRPWISRSDEIFVKKEKEEEGKNENNETKPVGSKENIFIHTEEKAEENDTINKEKE
jgi:cell division protease FtsH